MSTQPIISPTVHLNGTSGEDLLEQYTKAREAVQAAIAALPMPHGRDYYILGNFGPDVQQAIAQRNRWHAALEAIEADLTQITEDIYAATGH